MIAKPRLALADYTRAAQLLGCEVAAVRAVVKVESPKGGFNIDGTLTTLFEAHIFHRETKGKWTATHPHISSRSWNTALYGSSWQAERVRLAAAGELDAIAAIRSTSWGMFQIMGFNHKDAGFVAGADMVNAFATGEPAQLQGFLNIVRVWGIAGHLRTLDDAQSRLKFALRYNGEKAEAHGYPQKIGAALAWARANSLKA